MAIPRDTSNGLDNVQLWESFGKPVTDTRLEQMEAFVAKHYPKLYKGDWAKLTLNYKWSLYRYVLETAPDMREHLNLVDSEDFFALFAWDWSSLGYRYWKHCAEQCKLGDYDPVVAEAKAKELAANSPVIASMVSELTKGSK